MNFITILLAIASSFFISCKDIDRNSWNIIITEGDKTEQVASFINENESIPEQIKKTITARLDLKDGYKSTKVSLVKTIDGAKTTIGPYWINKRLNGYTIMTISNDKSREKEINPMHEDAFEPEGLKKIIIKLIQIDLNNSKNQ